MENAPTIVQQQNRGIFFDPVLFSHAEKVAAMFAESSMTPAHFRPSDGKMTKEGSIGNIMIALDYAHRSGMPPILVMQKMYIIGGRPALEAQLKIAAMKSSGRFSDIQYEHHGNIKDDNYGCRAYAKNLSTGETLYGPWISWKLVKAEGWINRNGSKWKTMPEKMFMYRAASWWIDVFNPDASLGMPTKDELLDAYDTKQTDSGTFEIIDRAADLERRLSEPKAKEVPSHPWARPNWIGLRGPGFSTYVWQNIGTFQEALPEVQAEVRAKWGKLYPGEQFPADKPQDQPEPEDAPQASQDAPGGTNAPQVVHCPNEGEITPQECKNVAGAKGCRDGCPCYE